MKNNKFKELFRILKFTLISISAGIVQIGLFTLFNEVFKWNYWLGYLLSLLISIIWNFTINRKVTFKSANNVKIAMILVLAFYAVFTPLSTWLGQLAESNGVNEYLVLAVTMISNFVLEFLYTRFIVYRNSCDSINTLNKNTKNRKPFFFNVIVFIVRIFYRKRKIVGTENLPEEPSLIIGNHAQMHGPIDAELFFPSPKKTWCIGQMMNRKEVPAYAYLDFWSHKPKCTRWFYKLLSHLIAPISAYIFTHADTIPVYKDTRLIKTFKLTIENLEKGSNIIIFPEKPEGFNEIVNEFQDKFIDVAKLYYDKYGKTLSFVPMYNGAKLKIVVLGKPIQYNPTIPLDKQRKIICDYLKNEITALAKSLPTHRVVPYLNIKKKDYPMSK